MFKSKKSLLAMLLVIISLIIFQGCPKNFNFFDMPQDEKMAWIFSTYNSQRTDYMVMNGYSFNNVSQKWEKVFDPKLSKSEIEILKKKKSILDNVAPLIYTYDSIINAGNIPDRQKEEEILVLLNKLLYDF